jgi:hypothetical protein
VNDVYALGALCTRPRCATKSRKTAMKISHALFLSLLSASSIILRPASATAANPAIAVGSVTAAPGTEVDVPVTFVEGATGVDSLQLQLDYHEPLLFTAAAPGAAATAVGASVTFQPLSRRAIVAGLGIKISDGTVLTVHLKLDPSVPPGKYTVGLLNLGAWAPGGVDIPLTGTPGTITVQASQWKASGASCSVNTDCCSGACEGSGKSTSCR